MDEYKRDSERLDLLGLLAGEVMAFQQMGISQISLGGMQIETGFPLHLGSLHDFRITLAEKSIIVKGRIVHSHISEVDQDVVTYRSGVEFTEPSERILAVISGFLELLRQNRQ